MKRFDRGIEIVIEGLAGCQIRGNLARPAAVEKLGRAD